MPPWTQFVSEKLRALGRERYPSRCSVQKQSQSLRYLNISEHEKTCLFVLTVLTVSTVSTSVVSECFRLPWMSKNNFYQNDVTIPVESIQYHH